MELIRIAAGVNYETSLRRRQCSASALSGNARAPRFELFSRHFSIAIRRRLDAYSRRRLSHSFGRLGRCFSEIDFIINPPELSAPNGFAEQSTACAIIA